MDPLNFRSRDFVHLHLHTDYSLLQSTIQLKPLAKTLGELDMKACAITDYGNMYGAVSFYNTMKSAGIRPIVGYEAMVTYGSRFDKTGVAGSGDRPYYHLILLAKNFEGYQNLTYLSSKAFTEGFHYKPRIDLELLAERSGGLIALSAGRDGAVRHFLDRGDEERAAAEVGRYREIFGADGFYLEVQDEPGDRGREAVKRLVELSKKTGAPVAATNDAHYLVREDARAQAALICISEGRTLDAHAGLGEESTLYLRSADEMWDIFGAELPEALTNTMKIAEMCDLSIPMGSDNLTLPEFPIPPESGCTTTDDYFEKVINDGYDFRDQTVWQPMREAGTLKYDRDKYRERLAIELGVIRKMGYAGYFLIVWDFIKFARQQGIPVGPGRGSAAGSLIAYCLGITDVDPLQYDLLFERFLNPERVSMPDIDIDFCIRGRGDVINHVMELYGRDSVCQIVTFGTMASRAAIKDVGRALSMPYGEVEKVAKLIPPPVRGRNVSISQALEQVPELKAMFTTDPKVKDLVDLALRIEGCSRHTSVHAAGVVISPKPLHELVPVAVSAKSELTSQYTMNDLEKVGMLKMDFLALTTLTVISDCLNSLKQKTGIEIDWSTISLSDEKTMALFGEGRTEAIFQFESSGMQEICRRLKPKELEDLSALNALYRPGPIDGGMIDDYIARHRGEKRVQYLVKEMEGILKNTYGVLVYQEQIMQLAQNLAGYSLGDADMMRRAMGKKKREEMAVHEEKFVKGAVERGIDKKKAQEIFTLMAQFADYGFNRSHSIAYAYLAFQTAYLKAHYPAYFYAAVLSHEAQDSAKVYKYSNELRSMGLGLLPPDINESDDGFTPLENAVRFGLTAIKGIGSASVSSIVKARRSGNFTSLLDFVSRVEQGAVNRRAMESLTAAGAFDSLKPEELDVNTWRARVYAGIDGILQHGQRAWEDKIRGQNALFGVEESAGDVALNLPDVKPWTQSEISKQEKGAIGFYLSVHPLDSYTAVLSDMKVAEIAESSTVQPGEMVTAAGIVSGLSVKYSKKGNRFCLFRLEDRSGGAKCLAWSEAFSKYADVLKDDEIIIVNGKVESSEGQDMTLIINDLTVLADAVPQKAREIEIGLPDRPVDDRFLEDLVSLLGSSAGGCSVVLNMPVEGATVRMRSMPLSIQGSYKIESELLSRGCNVNWIL